MGCAASNDASDDVMLHDIELQTLVNEYIDEHGHHGDNLEAACSEALYFDWYGDNELAPEVITRINYEDNCSHGAFGKCERYHIEWYYENTHRSTCYQVVLKDNQVKVVNKSAYFESERVSQGGRVPMQFRDPISPPKIEIHEAARPRKEALVINQLKQSLLSGSLEMNKGFVRAKYLTCPFSSHTMQHPDYPKDVRAILEEHNIVGCEMHDVIEGKETKNFKGVPAAVACLKIHCEDIEATNPAQPPRRTPACMAHQALHEAMAGVSLAQYRQELQEEKKAKKASPKKK